ncbi:MAG: YbaB/EbfC family nucleoid-associated protein [Planctomycetota bacterium]
MMDFKAMGAIASLLRDQDKLKDAAERVKERLDALRVEGSAGGGAVRVGVTGTQAVVEVSIDPSVGAAFGGGTDAQEMAQKLVAEATNDGLLRARNEAQRIIEAELAELGLDKALPGLMGPGGIGGLLGR